MFSDGTVELSLSEPLGSGSAAELLFNYEQKKHKNAINFGLLFTFIPLILNCLEKKGEMMTNMLSKLQYV